MRCLRELGLEEEYRTGRENLVRDFYVPCLVAASNYDRAVGYFTSSALELAARGFEAFARNDARARLVASPELTQDDVDAIERGLIARDDLVERKLLEIIRSDYLRATGATHLAWLVAEGRLDIRLAIPRRRPGIYHEKVGIFRDGDGCVVAFSGSANETYGGLVGNFETIDVFFSWDGSAPRVDRKCENFDRLWSGETRDLTIMDLPDAVRSELIRIARPPAAHVAGDGKAPYGSQGPAAGPLLRDYQVAAVGAWLSAGARGILSMATGAGKTRTALAAIRRFAAETPVPPVVVIVAPFIHLVDQWDEECRASGMRPILCYESSKDWQPRAWEALDAFRVLPDRPPCYIATMHTATLGPFAALLRAVADRPTLLVADEVHHLGSDTGSTILDQRIDWRLGLSATPQRWNDELGTALIESYFGGVVYEYTIAQAIAGGYLVPYRYEPILVDLDRDELGEYRDLMTVIEQHAADPEARSSDRMRRLLERRALLLNSATGKYAALRHDVENRRLNRALVYCASRLQLGAASDVIRDIGFIPVPFTAEEGRVERGRILRDFEIGRTPAIVAMRALDEGVDIPDTREAHLLASSGNPREFIQRRGRILRLAPGKREARLVDYVVIPTGRGVFEREIAKREMERVLDFAASSLNPDHARSVVWPVLNAFDLLHLVGRS